MSNLFLFEMFGIQVSVNSSSSLFFELIKTKFNPYNHIKTKQIATHRTKVFFTENKPINLQNAIYYGDGVWKKKQSVIILHRYLGSECYIQAQTNSKHQLINININFSASIIFLLLNFISGNKIKKQLFQNLIKLYIEQALLGYLCISNNMTCLHASSIEKNNKITIFAGLNGVGKSTLALSAAKKKGAHLYSDNYLLIKGNNAFLTPDSVRLKKDSIKSLKMQTEADFGFEKYYISEQNWSTVKTALIKKTYLVSRGKKWLQSKKETKNNTITKLQKIYKEEVTLSPLMILFEKEYSPQNISFFSLQISNKRKTYYEF